MRHIFIAVVCLVSSAIGVWAAESSATEISLLGKKVLLEKAAGGGSRIVVDGVPAPVTNGQAQVAIEGRQFIIETSRGGQGIARIRTLPQSIETIKSIAMIENPGRIEEKFRLSGDDGSLKFPNDYHYQNVEYARADFSLIKDIHTGVLRVSVNGAPHPVADKEGIRVFDIEIEGARYALVVDPELVSVRRAYLSDLAGNRGIKMASGISVNTILPSYTDSKGNVKTNAHHLPEQRKLYDDVYTHFTVIP